MTLTDDLELGTLGGDYVDSNEIWENDLRKNIIKRALTVVIYSHIILRLVKVKLVVIERSSLCESISVVLCWASP